MSNPWWMTDTYNDDVPLPHTFEDHAGPNGVLLVIAHDNGSTERGWGEKSFRTKYADNRPARNMLIEKSFRWGGYNFAIVMRSVQMICIDIDGKNGGYDGARKLGMLPPTLAETSKSGDGYHLFYTVPEDEWDDDKGFALYKDRVGLEQGVDIRAVGCVYHTKTQRWNMRPPVELPQFHKDLLSKKNKEMEIQIEEIQKLLDAGDTEELMMLHESLKNDLKKPIPPGRRNNTLFAIGTQMYLAQMKDWGVMLAERALQVGLDDDEVVKLLSNIRKYGGK